MKTRQHLMWVKNSRYKHKRRKIKQIRTFLFILILVFTAALFIANHIPNNSIVPTIHKPFTAEIDKNISSDSITNQLKPSIYALNFQDLALINDGSLVLVNKSCGFGDDTTSSLVYVSNYCQSLDSNIMIKAVAANSLREMINAAQEIGYDKFYVTEGYRTYSYQQMLYDSANDSTFVAPPGHSEHQTGFAIDISYEGVNIENSEQGAWLAAHLYQFGFILRYPKDKVEITKYPYEAWHYRYVGKPHAYLCYENNFCLEEYFDYLKENRLAKITLNNKEVNVYYLNNDYDTIEIPVGSTYTASLENTGGVVTTVFMN